MREINIFLSCVLFVSGIVIFSPLPLLASGDLIREGGEVWVREVVGKGESTPIWFAGMDLDYNDHPHMAYSYPGIRYVTWDGFQWRMEIVDEKCDFRGDGDLVVAPDGTPHVFYIDRKDGRLKHAERVEGEWRVGFMGEESADWRVSAAVNGDGNIYVAYLWRNGYQREVRLAESTGGGGWSILTVNSTPTGYPAVAVAPSGEPAVAYLNRSGQLMLARWDGSSWHYFQVSEIRAGSRFTRVSLAIDPSGGYHVVYDEEWDIYYAHSSDGSSWSVEAVDDTGDETDFPSLFVDSSGYPHVAYRDLTTRRVVYAVKNGGSWRSEGVGESTGEYLEIKVTSGDRPVIGYINSSSDLLYATLTGEGWRLEKAAGGVSRGKDPVLCLDDDNRPHILYRVEGEETALKYSVMGDGGWETHTVEKGYSYCFSMDLDSSGTPSIAYIGYTPSASTYDLKYARWSGSDWIKTKLVDNIISRVILLIDSEDVPHIFYYDMGIKHLYRSGTTWKTEEVEGGRFYCMGISAAVGGDGTLHVVYSTGTYLKYARRGESGWDTQFVDRSEGTGRDCSLALDSRGYPHISYYDGENRSLRYTHWTGEGWKIDIVDSGGVGLSSSLDLDAEDRPHISYYDSNNKALKYAFLEEGGWVVKTLDRERWAGVSINLKIGSEDLPRIVYHNGESLFYMVRAAKPGAPTNVTAASGEDYINLTWEAPEDNGGLNVTSYVIYRGETPTSLQMIAEVNTNYYNDTGVQKGVTYYYAVSAVNEIGEGGLSDVVNATAATTPSAPRNLTAVVGEGVVNLTWAPPEDDGGYPILNYTLYRGTAPGRIEAFIELLANTTSYSDAVVEAGVTYYYAVSARNLLGEGPISEVVNATLPSPQPGNDSDSDGLPDEWEKEQFGNLTYGPGDDPDGDGYTNLQEYLNGTNPTNPSDHPGTEEGGSGGKEGGEKKEGVWERWGVVLLVLVLILGIALGLLFSRAGRGGGTEE